MNDPVTGQPRKRGRPRKVKGTAPLVWKTEEPETAILQEPATAMKEAVVGCMQCRFFVPGVEHGLCVEGPVFVKHRASEWCGRFSRKENTNG